MGERETERKCGGGVTKREWEWERERLRENVEGGLLRGNGSGRERD